MAVADEIIPQGSCTMCCSLDIAILEARLGRYRVNMHYHSMGTRECAMVQRCMDTHSYRLLQGHHSNQVSVSRSYCFRCTNWNAGSLQVLLVSHLYIPMPGCFYSWFALLCTCHDQQNVKICTGNFSPYYSTHKALSH